MYIALATSGHAQQTVVCVALARVMFGLRYGAAHPDRVQPSVESSAKKLVVENSA